MSEFSLLVGNGINNVAPGYSWDDLIFSLKARTDADISIRAEKPFPLTYEEIYLSAISKVSGNKAARKIEKEFKKCVATFSERVESKMIHGEICNIGASHILTTNYDFSLQKSIMPSFDGYKHDGIIKETKFNLFRRYKIHDGVTFWPIHGVQSEPDTIILGYEHYIGYVQKLRDYIVNGTDNSYRFKFDPLVSRLLDNKKISNDSWVELFFTQNIHIFGLGLGYVELDIWWLLNYRARRVPDGIVNNEILYYHRHEEEDGNLAKFELLKSFGVKLICLSSNGTEFYEEVLFKIKKYEGK
ncbi:SIR2 family protein [Serratia marcescens]|uniref:hypothetical protein n=1 Tax=Serratia marcescens TaxID=615 RepID=UPI00217923D0|nr:hypothetical protein [Serratia marcescens]CAI1535938.1 Uncharacterised protein [Serratia marcescens]